MTENDLSAAAEIESMCFADPWSESVLSDEINHGYSVYFAAVTDGRVIGYIGGNVISGECDITRVAVHKDFRRMGVAKALIEAFKQEADRVTLEVREGNLAAIALYEKCGFKKDFIRKNYYKNPTENAVLMSFEKERK